MSDSERIVRIENKIDAMGDKISSIDSTLAAQHQSLKYHIKRTDLLEKTIVPLQKHVNMVNGIFKLIGILAFLATIVTALIQIIHLK